jgi:hypothetical protein
MFFAGYSGVVERVVFYVDCNIKVLVEIEQIS